VIGTGFGGLFATKRLRREHVQVTMIGKTPYHLFQPLLYQVTTGILSVGEIAPAVREVLKRQRNVEVLVGTVNDIDLNTRTVTSSAAGLTNVTPYDSLIVAAGADQSYFGNEQFAEFAPGMKSIDDALTLRAQIFGAFELAELETDQLRRAAQLTFVVVGGGPTGVEMSGQLADLSHHSLTRNFRHIDPATARVILVEAGSALLPSFGPKLSARALVALERRGVDVLLNTRVVGVDAEGITVRTANGSPARIAAKTKVWAAGVSGSSLGVLLSLRSSATLTRSGQVVVQPDCSLPGHPEVFVVGDLMALDGLPGLAQVAIQSGQFAADQITRRLHGHVEHARFHYDDKGQLATVARFRGVASVGPFQLSGIPAWLLWLGVHVVYLVGFKNRVTVIAHWAVTFVGGARSERTAPSELFYHGHTAGQTVNQSRALGPD
jgi:NADH:ubiquinone reductase (H+-translocating)